MTKIIVAHSPDSDDAFMHYALAEHKIDTGDLEFDHVLVDIQTLNERASEGAYEVTAISTHAFSYVSDKYALLPHGASMGEGYGPMVVARTPFSEAELSRQVVAVPGYMTSAYLALKLWAPDIETVVMPFNEILPAVANGTAEAGLLIHEGQLTFSDFGLHEIVNLGVWWADQTGGLPLPLGSNAIRRDLGPEMMARVSHILRDSIAYALDHREEALDYALQFARDMEERRHLADRFVGMYVNQRTLDYGEDGRRAVRLFLERGVEAGIIPATVHVDFID
ncbi:MAG: 1,4-dihydroxy-6-naphthoate synthase [Abditibacteriota bacterium]|nr:1,4-dihydroxy-6-naphthoate synthase [Abditibacteriota bacterium]